MNRRNFLASALAIVGGLPFIKAQVLAPSRFDPLDTKGSAIVDVRDFGAQCDGVTDDTVAIQAALDYAAAFGGRIFIMRDCDVYISGCVHIPGNVKGEIVNNVFRNTPYSFDGPAYESAA